MTKLSQELIERLAEGTQDVVYLPPSGRASGREADPAVVEAAKDYFDSPDRLHGSEQGACTVLREKPIHRMVCYLSASGATAEDIAQHVGLTKQTIYTVLKQPWAQARVVEILKELGRDRVEHFYKNQVIPSLTVLEEIRDSKQNSAMARLSAANSILDRALGKPTTYVKSETTKKTVPDDAARLDAEILAVRKQLAAKGVEVPTSSN